jgi:ABC-type glycerol-3-phosphate transport system substrate-binding protein
MTRQVVSRRPAFWVLAVAVLVLALALTACGGRGAGSGNGSTISGYGTNQTTTTGSTGGSSSSASDLQSADQQIQAALQGLDSASRDANTDYSTQATDPMP